MRNDYESLSKYENLKKRCLSITVYALIIENFTSKNCESYQIIYVICYKDN